MTQLELPLDKLKVGARVRFMEKYPKRRWPGAPAEEVVKVTEGTVVCVLPAGQLPSAEHVVKGWFTARQRASSYPRVVLARRWSTHKTVVVVINHTVKVFDGNLTG